MSVIINAGVCGTASYESSLTSAPLEVNTPCNSTGPSGSIPISQVIGLQAVLDSKLNDVLGPVGIANVFASGVDLNLLAGLSAFGLTQADLQKLSLVDASAVEINYLQGVTGPLQPQIDAAYSDADFTAANQMIVSTGPGAGSIELISDVLNGTFGPGYEFANLLAPTVSLDFNNQFGINALDPVNAQDVATKNYVDTAVLGGGAFLPLAGGTMTGDIDMDGNVLILDQDADTSIASPIDDTIEFTVGGSIEMSLSATALDMAGNAITNLLDPVAAQDAATRNYVDTNFLPLTGGTMLGPIDMDGFNFIIDADGDTLIDGSVDDVITLTIGGTPTVNIGTDFDMGGLDVSNLPAVPVTALSAITSTFTDATYLRVDGTNAMAAALDFGGFNVANISDPVTGDEVGDRDYNDARYLQISNNLSDLGNVAAAQTNLGLALVAISGDYNDLINTPTAVSALNDLTDVNVGTPGPPQDGHVVTWNNGAGEYDLQPAPVTSVFGRTGTVVAVAGDYTAADITNVPAGNIAAVDVQAALNELDTEKLALAGGTMTGTLDMGGQALTNIGLPFQLPPHEWNGTEYFSTNLGGSFFIRTSAAPSSATPTYSFGGGTDTGMWLNGTAVATSVGGIDQLLVDADAVSVENNRLTNVNTVPDNNVLAAPGDGVNRAYIQGLGVQRILGSITGVDLLNTPGGTAIPIYTLPIGAMHMITKIIVRTSSYAPGASPVDPDISVGISGAFYDQILDTTVVSFGPTGAADQAVYLEPNQGADTPNAANTVSVQVDNQAAGTFTAFVVDVYIMGVEL